MMTERWRAGRAGDGRDARHRPRDRAARSARRARRSSARRPPTRAPRRSPRCGRGGTAEDGMRLDVATLPRCERASAIRSRSTAPSTILVNNAGITRDNLLLRMKDDEWDAVIATNLGRRSALAKAVLRGMMKARRGRIIQIGIRRRRSAAMPGRRTTPPRRPALIGFTKSLAPGSRQPRHHRQLRGAGLHRHRHDPGLPEPATRRAAVARAARPARHADDVAACGRLPRGPGRGLHHGARAARQRRHVVM